MATAGNQMKMDHPAKSELSKITEAVKEMQQFRIKVQNLEREKSTHVYSKHSEFTRDFSPLQEMDNKMSQRLKMDGKNVAQQLNKIKNRVKRFHRELQDVKPTPEFVEKLKVIMEEIESQITSFKDNQCQQFEELMRDEKLTSQEIIALEHKFDSWARLGAAPVTTAGSGKTTALASHRDITKDLPPEVAEFERFMQLNSGIRGGWDEYDHSTFLKHRNRHRGKLSFLREVVSFLPTKTEQEIRDHESWYQQYLQLNDRKKEAIQKWRDRKEVEKDQLISRATVNKDLEEEEQQVKQQRKQEVMEVERQQQRSQLNKWKINKELERAQAEERKLRQQMEKAKQDEREKQSQLERKKQVEEYKRLREEKERQQALERVLMEEIEKEHRQNRYGQEMIAKFRERDMATVNKKLEKHKCKQEAEKDKATRLEKIKHRVEVNVGRNPSRLLQPTAGWIERQRDTTPSGGGPMLHMPHRAVPTWRQGMS